MPHGTPDWGLVGPISVLYGLDDLGEQAVRLGAVSSWDRIGHVVFADNFREGLGAWRLEGSDVTAILCLFTEWALSSPFCVKMVNGSGGAQYARMRHYFGYEYRGQVGLEFNVTLEAGTEYLKFGAYSSLTTGRQIFRVRLTVGTGDVAHGSDGAGWTSFGNVGAIVANVWEWHNVKLVIDFSTGFFVRLVWEGTPINMSTIACVALGILGREYWDVMIENDADTAAQHQVYVDDVIVTIDQP